MSSCPTRITLLDYASGKLDEQTSNTISEHLRSCEACVGLLDDIEAAPEPLFEGLQRPFVEDQFTSEKACQTAVERSKSLGSSDLELGSLGDYELLEELGAGGMAVVFRARHKRLDKQVAVKILPESSFRHPESVGRFEREMRAIGRLEHPNIVQAFDAGECEGRHYLVMELVDGLDLSSVVQRVGPLSIADATCAIAEAAKGLQHAHDHGMVHRDIKPSNVMLTKHGTVKILDLGLALFEEPQLTDSELTSSGQIMGTLDYIAPEQLNDSHAVDRRVDIYALGATLYKLLTGKAPHAVGSSNVKPLSKLVAIAATPITPVNQIRQDVPQPLSVILDQMLSKNPDDRFESAEEVVSALASFSSSANLKELHALASTEKQAAVLSDSALKRTDPDVASALLDTSTDQEDSGESFLQTLVERRPFARRVGVGAGLLGLLVLAFSVLYVQIGKATLEVKVSDEQVSVKLREIGRAHV